MHTPIGSFFKRKKILVKGSLQTLPWRSTAVLENLRLGDKLGDPLISPVEKKKKQISVFLMFRSRLDVTGGSEELKRKIEKGCKSFLILRRHQPKI